MQLKKEWIFDPVEPRFFCFPQRGVTLILLFTRRKQYAINNFYTWNSYLVDSGNFKSKTFWKQFQNRNNNHYFELNNYNSHHQKEKKKKMYVLITRTCEYIRSHGKRDFVSVIKNLVIEGYDFPGRPNDVLTWVLMKRMEESQKQRRWNNKRKIGKEREN